ncbi:DUF3953 domain-containing protein [Salibacterium halotolerans]|uniref:DUF3953 domain-containing protein n=1 Tax=Salibacterium halotolerans TaxID=1884432 RepID=A0A1I5Y7V7_9BACI|nr:DUF3953 domain-containing protein [Salibacterium halotolerans]SFQ40017.1 Protein of unknown function [Salibacterium halotolerans]
MKILISISAVIVVVLASYSLITDNHGIQPYTNLLLVVLFILLGVDQSRENRKGWAVVFFIVAVFELFVSIISF